MKIGQFTSSTVQTFNVGSRVTSLINYLEL